MSNTNDHGWTGPEPGKESGLFDGEPRLLQQSTHGLTDPDDKGRRWLILRLHGRNRAGDLCSSASYLAGNPETFIELAWGLLDTCHRVGADVPRILAEFLDRHLERKRVDEPPSREVIRLCGADMTTYCNDDSGETAVLATLTGERCVLPPHWQMPEGTQPREGVDHIVQRWMVTGEHLRTLAWQLMLAHTKGNAEEACAAFLSAYFEARNVITVLPIPDEQPDADG